MNDNNDERTIWCGNLSEKVTEDILYELFYQVGPLERVYIPKDRDGKSRQYGFVTFCHLCSVEYALNIFHGTRLFDREVTMKSRVPRNNPGHQYQSPFLPKTLLAPELSHTDFIRGLSITPVNAHELTNCALRNPYSYSGHVDRSMLPSRSSSKRKYEDEPHVLQHTLNDNVKSPYVTTGTHANYEHYNHYMELGRQMLFGATKLPPLMVSSGNESYYGTPIEPPSRHQNSRHTPYNSKSDRDSHHTHRRSSHRHNRSYDRHDRRSN